MSPEDLARVAFADRYLDAFRRHLDAARSAEGSASEGTDDRRHLAAYRDLVERLLRGAERLSQTPTLRSERK